MGIKTLNSGYITTINLDSTFAEDYYYYWLEGSKSEYMFNIISLLNFSGQGRILDYKKDAVFFLVIIIFDQKF